MTFAYDGGQRFHASRGGNRQDAGAQDWTPEDLVEHARNTAGAVARSVAQVSAACAEATAATTAQARAAARAQANAALSELRRAARVAAPMVAQARDPAVVAVLERAAGQLALAEAEVDAVPVAAAADVTVPPESQGIRRFAEALAPVELPEPQARQARFDALKGIIDRELVHEDLDPLTAALATGGALAPKFARLPAEIQARLSAQLVSVRPRLLSERSDRQAAERRAAGGASPTYRDLVVATPAAAPSARVAPPTSSDDPAAETHDPTHALARMATAKLGITPRLALGEAGRAPTEARGAQGVAHGDTVAIHPDVDAETPEGKQVVLHELVHQAQAQLPREQDAGRGAAESEAATLAAQAAAGGGLAKPTLAIDLNTPAANNDVPYDTANDRSAARFLNEANARGTNITAREYLRAHLVPHVLPAIANHVARQRYALPERMSWADGDRSFGAEVIALIDDVFGGDAMYGVPELLAGTSPDVWTLIGQVSIFV